MNHRAGLSPTTEPAFAFLGGHPALDFANTVDWHTSDHPGDRIGSYTDLVSWAQQAGILIPPQAAYLVRAQAARHEEADLALKAARELREAIYRILTRSAAGRSPNQEDLDLLNGVLREGLLRLRVVASRAGLTLNWAEDDVLARPLWPVAWAAAQLLVSSDLARVKQCASADGCGWLFLDRSKNLSRRWCDMRVCGNVDKARRHRERLKSERKPGR